MLNCNTLIINSNNPSVPEFTIAGLSLTIADDGSIVTTDKDGRKKQIGRNKHINISINHTKQLILHGKETQVYFDNGIKLESDIFSLSDKRKNYIQVKDDGDYMMMYNIGLDMFRGKRSTISSYIKSSALEYNIIEKSVAYTFVFAPYYGYGSLGNAFIYTAKAGEEVSLYVKVKEGKGDFYTIPSYTSFNMFRIS